MLRRLVVMAVGAFVLACPPPPTNACGPSTCSGCCKGDSCESGLLASACGQNGASCFECSVGMTCSAGACSSAMGGGTGASGGATGGSGGGSGGGSAGGSTGGSGGGSVSSCFSCAGCCDSTGACLPGTSSSACGVSGVTCQQCMASSCVSGACTVPLPGGDDCTTASTLAFNAQNLAQVTVDPAGFADNTMASCGSNGIDAVAAFDVATANTFVTIDVTSTSGATPTVSLRSNCTSSSSEVVCSGTGSVARRLAAGRYFVWLETTAAAGPLTLTVRRTPVQTGDSCTNPIDLTFTNGVATASGTLLDFGPDGISCSANGRDSVYRFTMPTAGPVTVRLEPLSAQFDPTITLSQTTCGSSVTCGGPGPGAVEQLSQNVSAGTYLVQVKSANGSAGPYSLSVLTSVPDGGAPSACLSPLSLTFNASGAATAFVTTNGRPDTIQTCLSGVSSGPDTVYQFHVNSLSDLQASFTGAVAAVALRSTCNGPDLACGSAINVADLAPGDYFLITDSYRTETSTQTLRANLVSPRPVGETCARPEPLTLSAGADGGTVTVAVDLATSADDIPNGFSSGTCNGITNAPDRFYTFTIGRPLVVTLTATRTSSMGAVEVGLTSTAGCAAGSASPCVTGTTSATFSKLLMAGTHQVRVQGSPGTQASLTISAVEPPAGEFCGNVVPLTLPSGGGTQSVTGTTRGSTQENFNNACAGYDMPDRVYSVTLPDPVSNLTITSTAVGSTNAPDFIVVQNCNEIVPQWQRCGTPAAATKTLAISGITAGTWFVWVKGPVLAGTDYRLDFTSRPSPPGETCRTPIPITLSDGLDGGTATVSGTTVGANDDYSACSQISPAFGDVVYSITLGRPLDVRVTMTPTGTGAGTLTELDSTCFTNSLTCARGTAGQPVTFKASFDAGTALISVDHSSGGPGPFTLDVSAAPPILGDDCSQPIPLTFPATGGTQRVTVDSRSYISSSAACGRSGDAFYSLVLTQPMDVRVTRVDTTGSPRVGLGTSCGAITCQFGGTLAAGSVPNGAVLVFDADDFTEQVHTYDVTVSPPTPGDTCANPIVLSIPPTGGTQSLTGSLATAFDQSGFAVCATSYAERVYQFTTTQPLAFVAQSTPTPLDGGAPVLALRSTTCDFATAPIACGPTTPYGSSVRVASLPAGTHFLSVDRAAFSSAEAYALDVSLGSRPMGDSCANALPLGLPSTGPGEVTVHGDTRPAFHDVTPSCGASTGTRDAPDVIYSFTLASPMNVRLFTHAVTPGFRPTVAVKRGCATTDTDQACGWTPTFSPDTWTTARPLAAGTWYVVVDGYDALQAGAFDLTVRTSTPNLPGDSCTNPATLTLSSGSFGRATATGTFADFFEDHTDCWNSSGSDAVFSITTNQSRRVHVRATPSVQTAQPTLSLRTTCNTSTSALACERSSFDGTGRVAATIPAGTTSLIIKSGLAVPAGTFSLDVRVDDFDPGDVCSNARPLVIGGTTTGDSYSFGADATMSCDSTKAPDAYFTFTNPSPQTFTATLTRQNTSEPFSMALYPGCAGAELVCRSSGFSSSPLVLTQTALPAGTWVLVVRGGTTAPSGFSIAATLTP